MSKVTLEIDYVGDAPQYMTKGAAGADLAAKEETIIPPYEERLVGTNTKVKTPEGYFGMLVPRSSTCRKLGLELTNSVGIIDEDYVGEIMFSYRNITDEYVMLKKGERIGQLVILPYVKAQFYEVEDLEMTERGEKGFGSTG